MVKSVTNSSLVSNIYVGSDGKLHKVQGGADSVLPFSSKVKDFSTTLGCEIQGGGNTWGVACYVSIKNGKLSISWSHNGYVGGSDSSTVYFRTTPLSKDLYAD